MMNQTGCSDRRCAFQLKRPDRFPIFDIGCQFTGEVDEQLPDCSDELIEHKGKTYCPFHLPGDYWEKNERDKHLLGRTISEKIIDLAKKFQSDEWDYSLDLTGIVFPSDVRFEDVSFASVIFKGCEFLDHVTFKNCQFKYYAHFDCVKFHDHVNIYDCIFENELVFSNALFLNFFRINRSNTREIRAHNSKFLEDSYFSDFSVSDKFDLSLSEFSKSLSITRVKSINEILLIAAELSQGISIQDCHSAHVHLTKAKIFGRLNFVSQEFASLSLRDATFGDARDLSCAAPEKQSRRIGPPDWAQDPRFSLFESRASLCFDQATVNADADFSASYSEGQRPEAIFPKVSFKDATFLGSVSFNNRTFGDDTSFQAATFERAPSFHNSTLHQGTSFYRAQFHDYKRIKRLPLEERIHEAEMATRAFRTLKLASESVRARQEQARFFAEEEQRNRLDPDTSRFVVFSSWLYEVLSDYGRNFIRPALLWLITQVIFFFSYLAVLTKFNHSWLDLRIIIRLTFQQIFRPFQFLDLRIASHLSLKETYLRELSTDVDSMPVFLLAAMGMGQAILSVAFLALFLLALRRRFKID